MLWFFRQGVIRVQLHNLALNVTISVSVIVILREHYVVIMLHHTARSTINGQWVVTQEQLGSTYFNIFILLKILSNKS
ncbi:hypothetical protein PAECIP112173_02990 [Paenibacillus sp. JJ-100]|nr:hypothetical protein PAECIP112173_02990 [Paenibacillus sp. JJ-100]